MVIEISFFFLHFIVTIFRIIKCPLEIIVYSPPWGSFASLEAVPWCTWYFPWLIKFRVGFFYPNKKLAGNLFLLTIYFYWQSICILLYRTSFTLIYLAERLEFDSFLKWVKKCMYNLRSFVVVMWISPSMQLSSRKCRPGWP